MARITNLIDIDASPPQVYAAIRALDAYPDWLRHSLVYRGTRNRTPDANERLPDAAGRLTYEDATMIGRMRGELVEDVPDRLLRFHQHTRAGGVDAVIRYDLDAAESVRTLKCLKAHVERMN